MLGKDETDRLNKRFFDCLNKRWGFAEEAWESADGSTWESFQGWILYYYVQATSVFATMLWHRPPFFCLLHQPMHKTSSQSGTCLDHTVWSTPSWAPKNAILDGCSTVVRVIRALGLDGLELWVVRGVEHSDYCNRSHFDKSALSFATRALFLSLLNQSSQLSPTLQGRLSSKVKMSKGQGWTKPHLTRCHILNINILRELLQ